MQLAFCNGCVFGIEYCQAGKSRKQSNLDVGVPGNQTRRAHEEGTPMGQCTTQCSTGRRARAILGLGWPERLAPGRMWGKWASVWHPCRAMPYEKWTAAAGGQKVGRPSMWDHIFNAFTFFSWQPKEGIKCSGEGAGCSAAARNQKQWHTWAGGR